MIIFNFVSVCWLIVYWVKCNFKKIIIIWKKGEDLWIWDVVDIKLELFMDNFLCFLFRIGCVYFFKVGY